MTASEFFNATSLRRLSHIGSLLTLLALLVPSLAFLFSINPANDSEQRSEVTDQKSSTVNRFVLLLLTLGVVLILAPEFVYLRDKFGYRINTVFKFYYQAWIILSLVATFGISQLLKNLRGVANVAFRIVIGLVVFTGLLYPVFGLLTKTNNFEPTHGFTLDDFDRITRDNPDEAAAIQFLHTAPDGIIAEAVGDGYSGYARISAYTGLQTVLGWPGHEDQWRGSYAPQGTRRADITELYSSSRWEDAKSIIDRYNIRYIYVGNLERVSMRVNEGKFQSHLKIIFQQGNTVIYEVP